MCCSTPRPPHFGQAPNGLLNENSRGSISGMVKPDTGQANFAEKTMRSAVSLRRLLAFAPAAGAASAIPRPQAHRRARALFEIRKPRRDVGPHHDAVDHDVDVVFELFVERRHIGDLVKGAVDFDALKAPLHEFGEFLAIFALAAAHHRREQIKPRAFGQRDHAVDHLADRLALDRQAGGRRIGNADARPQKPHVVVDLGDGADRRARIFRGRLLLDRDGRREAVDLIDVRLLHHLEELPRIGRQAFDIAALALGIDGVEGERGFAGARKAGEHHELVARDVEIDIFQIMLARAADGDHAGVTVLAAGGFIRLVEQVAHGNWARFPCRT